MLASGIILVQPATALTSCTPPSAPWIPSGTGAAYETMEAAYAQVQAYNAAVDAYVACLSQQYNEAEAARADVNDRWVAAVEQYEAQQQ